MRKWTYLVAALLMGGATATFTSCIDTDEPAGIEQLRGAKAALIQAKADYQAQLTAYREVQVRMAEVDLKMKEVALEIEQLKVAKAQAQNEYDIAAIQNDIEQLAERQKAAMLELQAETARQQEALEEALTDLELALLTYKDGEYQAAIQTAIGEVQTLRGTLAVNEESLKGYKVQLINAQAQLGDAYRAGLVADSLAYEKSLENLRFSLEQVKALPDANYTDVSGQVTAISKQIADIEAQALEITNQIAAIEEAIYPVTNEIAKIESEYADPKNVVEIPVAQVPAAIQEDVIAVLTSTNVQGTSVKWDKKAAAPFYNEDKDEMTADFVTQKTSLKNSFASSNELDGVIDNLVSAVNLKYEVPFFTAYNNTFGTSYSSGSNEVSPEMIAMAKTKVAELEKDAVKSYAIFQADSLAWDKAYKAYKTAADAYGYQYNLYDETAEVLNNYWSAPASEKPTWAEIKKALKDYYAVRVPLFGKSEIIKVPVGSENLPLSDVLDSYGDGQLQLVLDGNQTVSNYLGEDINLADDKNQTIAMPSDEKDYGALHTYLAASKTVWGTDLKIGAARVTAATEDEYDYSTTPTSTWKDYMDDATALDIFKNIESWIALEDFLKAQSDTYQAAIEDIEQRVSEKNMAIAAQRDQIYKLEFDRYALDGTRCTSGNPYYNSLTVTIVAKTTSLSALRQSIINNSQTGNQYQLYLYVNPVVGWQLQIGSKDFLISAVESSINTTQQSLDEKKAEIEIFDAGLTEGYWGNTIAYYEQMIADCEKQIAEDKANLERAEATLNKLLEAYAASAE